MSYLNVVRRTTSLFNTTLVRPAAYFSSVSQKAVKADPNSKVNKEFVSSETNKLHNVVQSEIETHEGKKKVTIPPKKWSEDYASSSEAIIKAESSKDKSIEDLQRKTLKTLEKKEKREQTLSK